MAPPLGAVIGVVQNLLTLAFWGMIAADHAGHFTLIDAEYKATGFCRASAHSHGFDSYQLCFVVDTLGCVLLLALWWRGKHGSATVGPAASIFMHGAFHMAQFLYGWPLPLHVQRLVYPAFTLAFVGGFGVGSKVGTKLHLVLIAAAIELFRMAFVSNPFAFAYVNTWVYALGTGVGIAQGVTQGVKPPPPSAGSMFIMFGVLVPFCEAILCNQGFKSLGGHAIFDTTIVAGSVLTAAFSPSMTRGDVDKKRF